MDAQEGWNRTLVYVMSVFEDVATVRHISAIKSQSAQIWGSFRTTELLDEYVRLRFICHPQVLSLLALTSMQREGVAVSKAIKNMNSDRVRVDGNVAAIKRIEEGIKKMKKDNPP